jgi:glycosyltransferase involved in cell wall biosynthesis
MSSRPLLSIIIPTKNRQYTCLYAIESALLIDKNDIEIIIQDCSDTNDLERQIIDKFANESRIKYEYTNDSPDMTTNWNRAFYRAKGDYLCGIGDDDAVLTEIYDLVNYCKSHKILTAVNLCPYSYFWPGFDNLEKGVIAKRWTNSGKIGVISDGEERHKKYARLHNIGAYGIFPNGYHDVVSREVIENVIKKTGKLFDGLALDIYAATVITSEVPYYLVVDFPFTLKGCSKDSNTERHAKGKIETHFKEFSEINWFSILPTISTDEIVAAQSILQAYKNLKKDIVPIDLSVFYGRCLARYPSKYREILRLSIENKAFNANFFLFFFGLYIRIVLRKIKNYLPIAFNPKGHMASNIIEAICIIRQTNKDIRLDLKDKLSPQNLEELLDSINV